jgi:putative endonuclease
MQNKGNQYEQRALQHLKRKGLTLITKNFHSRFGEIDLIMEDKGTIVFIEVRYRGSNSHGSASESVTPRKQQKIIKTAKYFLSNNQLWERNVRFDVVAISPVTRRFLCRHHIDWITSAFCVSEVNL